MNVVHENILVEIPEVEKERNGVLLPEGESKVEQRGTVIRFGEALPDNLKLVLSSKPKIQFKEYYDGGEIEIKGKKYLVMNYRDILIIE